LDLRHGDEAVEIGDRARLRVLGRYVDAEAEQVRVRADRPRRRRRRLAAGARVPGPTARWSATLLPRPPQRGRTPHATTPARRSACGRVVACAATPLRSLERASSSPPSAGTARRLLPGLRESTARRYANVTNDASPCGPGHESRLPARCHQLSPTSRQ